MIRLKLGTLIFCLIGSGCWAPSTLAAKEDSSGKACGAKVESGMQQGSMKFGLLERSYQVYVPRAWDNQTPRPLVLGLHGGWGSGEIFNQQTAASKQADKHNMLLVLPDGHYKSWNAGSCCKPAAKQGVRDVEFVAKLVDVLSQQYCVDRSKIFATGFSNGAMLTHRIACEKPGLLRGIAPVSGGIMSRCENAASVAALLIQGRDDPRIFWDGGTFDGSYRPSMAEVVQNLASRNACESVSKTRTELDGPATCKTLQSCGKQPLKFCGVQGVGHQWPGGKSYWPDKLGANTKAFDATEVIFDFFSTL